MVAYGSVGAALRRVSGIGLLALSAAACGASSKHAAGDDATGAQAGEADSGGTSASSGGTGGGATSGRGGRAGDQGGSGGSATAGGSGGVTSGGSGGNRAGSGGTGGNGVLGGGSGGVPNLEPPTTTDFLPVRPASFDKLDLLFMIDNSPSMQGKQELLAESVPALLDRLLSPNCVDENGERTGGKADPSSGMCQTGEPEFRPVHDVHVGVITSSLGGHGSSDVCSDAQNNGGSFYDDLAQLLPSVRPSASLYSWNDSAFLVWDPRDQSSVSDPHTPVTANETDERQFITNAGAQITAPGDTGCGYESSLEAWYRFLIDPAPVESMSSDGQVSVRGPTNQVLLAQRQMFLRDDSLLGIVMLTDENDCSIVDEDGTQGWLVGFSGGTNVGAWHMPYANSSCQNPNDPCCRPCPTPGPAGCNDNAFDPVCSSMMNRPANDDSMNLRCFQQKQRFGIDLLYPTSRYVEALTSVSIVPRPGGLRVDNPLFESGRRTPQDVVLLALVGVPWQDISTEDSWSGRDLTYLTARELADGDRWPVILGDVNAGVMPTDTLMVESIEPRTGPAQKHPLLDGVTIAPPTATTNTNPINGHEQAETPLRDDLQFACIFPLEQPIGATECAADPVGCDCNADELARNSPLCSGITATTDGEQLYGKAYPGLRELEVVKNVGDAAVLASICAKNTTPMGSPATDGTFGYNPALTAFVARLAPKLEPSCLPLPLGVSGSEPPHLACHVAEILTDALAGGSCDCSARGLSNAGAAVTAKAYADLEARRFCGDAVQVSCDNYCVCEVPELDGDTLTSCLNDEDFASSVEGFCYVDPAQGSGDRRLVLDCPPDRKRYLRFSGDLPGANATPFVDCAPEDQ
jgi:hypothetical protein